MGLPGPELTGGVRDLIRDLQPGGFILFARNLASAGQTYRLLREVRDLLDAPPFLTIDQEGGRVARLQSFAGRPVSGEALARANRAEWAATHGKLTGEVLRLFGFNLNLAPVVDYDLSDSRDNSLSGRCLGTSPDQTIELAGAFLDAMQNEQVLGTIKHFPGYTYCENDPHADLPRIPRSLDVMEQDELRVFRALFSRAEAVMIGHGHFTHWHPEPYPASLSRPIVSDLLRDALGYRGLVMTDDLEMGAIARRYSMAEATRLALEAGNDLLLVCHNPACAVLSREALEDLPSSIIEPVLQRITEARAKLPDPPVAWDQAAFEDNILATRQLREQVEASLK